MHELASNDQATLEFSSELLEQSRTVNGRQHLLESGAALTLPATLHPLAVVFAANTSDSHNRSALVWGLQLARNMCAAGESACNSLLLKGMLATVLSVLDALQQTTAARDVQLQKLVLQFLVNMAASSSACLDVIWDECFPSRLAAVAKNPCKETAGPLCMLLLLAVKDSQTRANHLCSPSAAAVLKPLLAYIGTSTQPSSAAGTLGLIIHHVIWQQGLLQSSMTSLAMHSTALGADTSGHESQLVPCMEHVVMLQLLADELEDPAATRDDGVLSQSVSIGFLVFWVHDMCSSLLLQQCSSTLLTQNLEAGLQVLRALTAQDEAAANHDSITEDHLITMLVTTLAMLAALNPIQPPRRPNQSNQQPASSSSSTIQPQPASESAPLEHNQTIPSCQVSAHTGTNQPGPDVANLHTSDNLHGLQLQATTPSAAGPDCQDLNHIEAHCPVDQALNQQAAGTAEELIRLARQYPKQSLYKCYRCDLVALLANLCFRRHAVQQKVQQLGGVELILSQCQWDDENPLVREYGLWAVRNLCEGNESIQESISSLRACSTVDSPDLQQIGMKLELDGQTGKPKMVAHSG